MDKISLPDITLAQVVAALTWIGTQLVTMGVADQEATKLFISSAITIVTAAWMIGDSIIRHGRATGVAKEAVARGAELKKTSSIPRRK